MNQAALAGLVVGAVLGGAYAWWQLRSLRQQAAARLRGEEPKLSRQLVDAVVRIGLLVAVLALVATVPPEKLSRGWLVGAVVLCYTVPFVVKMKRMWSQK
jgi:hypothetical protein